MCLHHLVQTREEFIRFHAFVKRTETKTERAIDAIDKVDEVGHSTSAFGETGDVRFRRLRRGVGCVEGRPPGGAFAGDDRLPTTDGRGPAVEWGSSEV